MSLEEPIVTALPAIRLDDTALPNDLHEDVNRFFSEIYRDAYRKNRFFHVQVLESGVMKN